MCVCVCVCVCVRVCAHSLYTIHLAIYCVCMYFHCHILVDIHNNQYGNMRLNLILFLESCVKYVRVCACD